MIFSRPISTAKLFFEEIKCQSNTFDYLKDIASPNRSEPFFEEEWLDFKGMPQDDKDAKKIWSKALSSFANITDGLIIWGIDARKIPPRDIDAACGLRLIKDPQAFESRLRDWIRDATNPPVMGIEYQSYTNEVGEGFVVCLIPESNHKPHRAEFADKHYYYRAGDDFLVAEPGLLRTLFYPQYHPYLWIELKLSYQLYPPDLADSYKKQPEAYKFNKIINNASSISVEVLLHNSGVASAKDAYVVINASEYLNFSRGYDWANCSNPQAQAALQAVRTIHPGEVSILFSGDFQKTFPVKKRKENSWEIVPYFNKLSFSFICYTENFRHEEIIIEFTPDDFDFMKGLTIKNGKPNF